MTHDKNGKPTSNEDDTYLRCRNGIQIFRFSKDKLAIQFNSTGVKNNRMKELSDLGVQLEHFVSGDDESVYLFNEKDLLIVASVVKPMTKGKDKNPKKRKVNISDERREQLRKMALSNGKFKNKGIT